ncbi:Auxin efflux carrier [Desulfonema limicola]|uniref:Auxin efflux carrier n=1 Tax=Desulfonema limicola TaxID=45656 RepID=A0A975BBM3_9BACT|nr:AEC family transporter [Desulfonema limicola]QTA82388.1 Auxin efflux carrier [Desulfonema limicola]
MILVLNGLFPVFALLVLGNVLKHLNLTNEVFLKASDKLIYYIFFPIMLFWKIGGAKTDAGIDWNFCTASICAVLTLYILSSIYIKLAVGDYEAGSFSQSCYRFNTYIGMAVIINVLGEEGVRHFGIMIGFTIPIINMLAVSTLIWYSGADYNFKQRLKLTCKSIISNPLILACFAGIIWSSSINFFPVFIDNAFKLASYATLPLALLSIGGALSLQNMKGYFKIAFAAAIFKLLIFPLTGYFFLRLFNVTGIPFKTGMIFFTLPASTAIYVLSSQLNSNTEMASASIVLSTILSFISISIILMLL